MSNLKTEVHSRSVLTNVRLSNPTSTSPAAVSPRRRILSVGDQHQGRSLSPRPPSTVSFDVSSDNPLRRSGMAMTTRDASPIAVAAQEHVSRRPYAWAAADSGGVSSQSSTKPAGLMHQQIIQHTNKLSSLLNANFGKS